MQDVDVPDVTRCLVSHQSLTVPAPKKIEYAADEVGIGKCFITLQLFQVLRPYFQPSETVIFQQRWNQVGPDEAFRTQANTFRLQRNAAWFSKRNLRTRPRSITWSWR